MRTHVMVLGVATAALVAAGSLAASRVADTQTGNDARASFVQLAQAGPMGGEQRGPGAMRRGPGPRMKGMAPGRPGLRALEQLDLTKQQRERIAELHEAAQRKAIRLRADLETAQLDLRKLMRSNKPDRRAIDTQIDRISGIRASLQKDRIGTMLDVRAVLTPEQIEKMESHRGHGWGAGLGPRHGWRGPDSLDDPEDEENDGESM